MLKGLDPVTRTIVFGLCGVGLALIGAFFFIAATDRDPTGASVWLLIFALFVLVAAGVHALRAKAIQAAFAAGGDRGGAKGLIGAVIVLALASQAPIGDLASFGAPGARPAHWTEIAILLGVIVFLAAAARTPGRSPRPAGQPKNNGFSWRWFLTPVLGGWALYIFWLLDQTAR